MLTFVRMPDEEDWGLTGLANAGLTFASAGYRNVKAELDVDLSVGENVLFDVSRAYIKVRFPWFRATLGKNRISWGEGVMFNAGDLIAASSGMATDLTQDVFHDQGVWMAEGYIPLGRFSFLELVVLPPVPELFPVEMPSINDTAAGARVYLKPLGIKTEAGYLFRAAEERVDMQHVPYLSLQWHLLVDWQVSASTTIPGKEREDEDLGDELLDELKISWGVFHMHSFPGGASLSLRLESMIRPEGSWEPVEHTSPDDSSESTPENYGILLYPEIVFRPSSSLALIGRSVVSPVDASALLTLGSSWNVYQGFSLLGFFILQAGGEDDLFGWDREGDIAVTLGMEFAF
jgi:hypothetical protein